MSDQTESSLQIEEIHELLGAEPRELSPAIRELIAGYDFAYREVAAPERDRLILGALRAIHSPTTTVAGPGRRPDWEKGWSENLEGFVASGYQTSELVPRYFKKGQPLRLSGRIVQPRDPDFLVHYTEVFRRWLFGRWFSEVPAIYEFGCGSGSHLALLGEIFPEKQLHGLDWATASQQILRVLAEQRGIQVEGHHFDFFHPDRSLALVPGSGVLTFGALEQVGDAFQPFLEYLLEQQVGICLHVEGFLELYDQDDLLDFLAIKYHEKRNYLNGLLTFLREAEREGRVELLKVHRQRMGVANDTYSYVAWRPARAHGQPRG